MNYIKQINGFEQWLETNHLSSSAQLLWYKLVNLFNKSGWNEWISVDNQRLMAAIKVSREATLIKVRDELIKAGLIELQKGKKGFPNRYKIKSFTFKNETENEVQEVVQDEVQSVAKNEVQSVVQNEVKSEVKNEVKSEVKTQNVSKNEVQSEVQNEVKRVVQSVDIYKQNKIEKEKINKKEKALVLFERFWEAYPKKTAKLEAEKAFIKLDVDDGLLDTMLTALEKQSSQWQQMQYIPYPATWLNGKRWEDELESSGGQPEPKNPQEIHIPTMEEIIAADHPLTPDQIRKMSMKELFA